MGSWHLHQQRKPTATTGLQRCLGAHLRETCTRYLRWPTTDPQPSNWKAYLDRLPKDPWGRPYLYLNPGLHGEIDVFTLGADGQPAGSGADADIGSWDL